MVCFDASEPHIRILWVTQFVTPTFEKPTPEDGKLLSLTRDIQLGLLTAMVVVQPECLTSEYLAVPQAAEMEALVLRLAPGHPLLPRTPQGQRGSPYPGHPWTPSIWFTR